MRQYAVILIALVVLVGGLVARWKLAPAAGPVVPIAEVESRALADAEALSGALAAGERSAAAIEPKVVAVERSCAALEAARVAPACVALRGRADGLRRAARAEDVGASAVEEVAAAVTALRGELTATK